MGSNPVGITFAPLAQLVEHLFYMQNVLGSNPRGCTKREYRQGPDRVCKTSSWWFDSICSHNCRVRRYLNRRRMVVEEWLEAIIHLCRGCLFVKASTEPYPRLFDWTRSLSGISYGLLSRR